MAWPMVVAASLPLGALAQALPSGGVVAAGKASIGTPAAGSMVIKQDSQRAVLHWAGFGVAKGNTVSFAQPNANAATLNVVKGSLPSTIAGSLSSNGSVFLINQNGIAITASGVVDTRAGFVASTLGMDEDGFMAGKHSFRGKGGAVLNQGRIVTGPGGNVALLGASVSNEGTISAPLGKVALASGEAATLDLSGDGYLQVLLPSDAATADGQALVGNSGVIEADGGMVMLKAATVGQALREAVHMPGAIRARSVSSRDGVIVLEGGDGGAVRVAGSLDVAAQDGGAGGRIDAGGAQVALAGARLDASGEQRGGLVRVGGGFQGGKAQVHDERFGTAAGAPTNAATTSIDAASRIDVSARGPDGVGGSAIVWSDKSTVMRGAIDATGAASAGAVEVSSASTVQSVALDRIKLGKGGKLLLDPQDIQIDDFQPGLAAGSIGYGDNPGGVSHLYSADLTALLSSGTSVSLKASQDISWSTFNATVSPAVGATAGSLALAAGRSVILNGTFTTGDANWRIVANDSAANGVVDAERGAGLADIDLGGASFINSNGHLSLLLSDGAGNTHRDAGSIRLGSFSGDGLTASVDSSASPWSKILLLSDLNVANTIALSGKLQVSNSQLSLSGKRVDWTTEESDTIVGEGRIRFIENGVITRFGSLGGLDATRLALGDGLNTGASRVYGDTDPTPAGLGVPLLHVKSGTAQDAMADILADGSFAVTGPGILANAGSSSLTLGAGAGLAFAPGLAGSYFIDMAPVTMPLTIQRRVVTPVLGNASGTYGTPITAVTLANVANNDVLAPIASLDGGAPRAMQASGAGFSFGTAPKAGLRNYSVTGLAGGEAANYSLSPGPWNGTLSVDRKPLNYHAFHANHVYGDSASAWLNLSGIVGGDEVSALPGALQNGVAAPGGRLKAGNYLYTAVGLAGADAANYQLAASGNDDWAFSVAPRPLNYTVAQARTTYGTAAPLGALTLNNVLAGDALTPGAVGIEIGGVRLSGVGATTPAGVYQQTINSLGGADAANYTLAGAVANGSVTVDRKVLRYTGAAISQQYGQHLPLPALDGIVNGDQVSGVKQVLRQTVTGNPSSTGFPSVGFYEVGYSGLAGTGAANYVLGPANISNAVTVTPRVLTYAGGSANLVYGDGGSLTHTLDGVLPGDEQQVRSFAYVSELDSLSSAVAARAPAGSYEVKVNLQLFSDSNYALATSGNSKGVLTIAKRPLTWTVGNGTAQYGDMGNNPVSFGNLLAGDEVTPVVSALDVGGAPIARAGVGVYAAGVSSLGGAAGANYSLAASGNTTGQLTITPKQLQLIVNPVQSVYGTLASPSVILNGLVDGENLGLQTQTVVRQNGSSVLLSDRLPAGSYTIDATVTLGANPNYTLASPTASASLEVAKKPLSYEGPRRSYEYGTAVRDMDLSSTLVGVLSGDIVSLPTVLSGAWAGVEPKRSVGSYHFPVSLLLGLSGRDAGNYSVSTAGSSDGMIEIVPKTLHYSSWIDGRGSYTYGELGRASSVKTDFAKVYQDDDVRFAGAHVPGAAMSSSGYLNVGSYTTAPGDLTGADARNYRLAATGNSNESFVVVPYGLTADPQILSSDRRAELSSNLVYGGTSDIQIQQRYTPPRFLGDSVAMQLNFQLPTGATNRLPDQLDAGSYDIVANLSGRDAGNYFVKNGNAGVVGKIDVARRPVSVSYADVRTTYGSLATLSPTINNALGRDLAKLGVSGELLNSSNFPVPVQERTPAGDYTYKPTALTGDAARNYVLEQSGATYPSHYGAPLWLPAGRNASVQIAKKQLSASYTGPTTLTYGAVPGAISVTGWLPGDHAEWMDVLSNAAGRATVRNSSYALDRVDAGTYDYLVDISAMSANYTLSPKVATVTIEPRAVSGVAQGASIVYRDPNGKVTFDSLFGQVSGTASGEFLSGELAFFDASGKQIAYHDKLPAGSYESRIVKLVGAGGRTNPANYRLAEADAKPGKLEVTRAPLALGLPETLDTVYGTSPLFGRNVGIHGGDEVSFVLSGNGLVSQALSTTPDFHRNLYYDRKVDAGEYSYSIVLQGADAANYAITGLSGGKLVVAPKTLNWSVTPGSGQYGYYKDCNGYASACGVLEPGVDLGKPVFTGLVSGETVEGKIEVLDLKGKPMVVDAKTPVGSYFQVVSGISGPQAKNYRLATSNNMPGALTIHPLWLQWSTTSSVTVLGGYGSIGHPGLVELSTIGGVPMPNGETVGATSSIYFRVAGRVPLGTSLPAGRYYYVADTLTGEYAGNYRLVPIRYEAMGVPGGQNQVGVLDVYADSRFGLDMVSAKELPTARPPQVEIKSVSGGADSGYQISPIRVRGGDEGPSLEVGRLVDEDGISTDAGVRLGLTGVRVGAEVGAGASSDLVSGPVDVEAQASATVEALARFGVTGVTVSAGVDGHVDITISSGPVEATAGLQGSAETDLKIGTSGIKIGADASVGAYGGATVAGNILPGVTGSVGATGGTFAYATANYQYGIIDGVLTMANNGRVGTAASAGVNGSMQGDAGNVAGGATVYTGLVAGGNLTLGGGYSDGSINVNIDLGVQLGIGFELKLDFGINVGAVGSVFSSLASGSGPSRLERQPGADKRGLDLKNDPAARFAYLSSNEDWNYSGSNGSLENREFLQKYTDLMRTTQKLYEDQAKWQAGFLELLKTDPAAAVEYSRTKPDFAKQQMSLRSQSFLLGVKRQVVDGVMKYVNI